MSKEPITVNGHMALEQELKNLKTVERPAVIEAIAEARAHGDLKENAEYHAAKEQQSFIEGRIKAITALLSNAEIIDPAKLNAGGRVVFGATVTLVNLESGEETIYQLVGQDEADIKLGKISFRSPLARAVIGQAEGSEVVVSAPAGDVEYEIVEVQYI